mmetsp:Transcript_10850/g.26215  ORF Transcript_10850/g.26215 Transcript_10850/m.26215 type:complete len:273 (-) Transcript_10850:190-1008(-)
MSRSATGCASPSSARAPPARPPCSGSTRRARTTARCSPRCARASPTSTPACASAAAAAACGHVAGALSGDDMVYMYLMRGDTTDMTLETLALEFGVSHQHARSVCNTPTIAERQRWQAIGDMLTDDESDALCPREWKARYAGQRVQMWDNTDAVRLRGTPTDAYVNHITYSEHHGGNVFKGGVGTTPWGFVTGSELRTGAEDDTSYFHCCHLVARMKAASAAGDDAYLKWVVMVDKGYRISELVTRAGQWCSHGRQFAAVARSRRSSRSAPC